MSPVHDLTGPRRPPESGGPPRQLVILLHGVGADGNDLIGLAPYWAPFLPDAEFLSPNAPFACDMAPFGYQWFSLKDLDPDRLLAGVVAAAPAVDALIDREMAALSLTPSDVALVGFSQGAMMALYVTPRRSQPLAALVSYSGALIGGDQLEPETTARTPMLLVHGDADPVVPVESLGHATAGLRTAGLPVQPILRRGLAHGIDPGGMELGGRFLAEQFAARQGPSVSSR